MGRCAGPEPADLRNVVIIVVSVIASLWVLNVAAITLFAYKTVRTPYPPHYIAIVMFDSVCRAANGTSRSFSVYSSGT